MGKIHPIDKIGENIFEKNCFSFDWNLDKTRNLDEIGFDAFIIPYVEGDERPDLQFYAQIKGSKRKEKFYNQLGRREFISQQLQSNRLKKWIKYDSVPIMICVVDNEREVIYWEFINNLISEIKQKLKKKDVKEPVVYIPSYNIFQRDKFKILYEIQRINNRSGDEFLKRIISLIDMKKSLANKNTKDAIISLIRIDSNTALDKIFSIYKKNSNEWRSFIIHCFRFSPPNEKTLDFLIRQLEVESNELIGEIVDYIIDYGSKKHKVRTLEYLKHIDDPITNLKRNILSRRIIGE